MDYNNNQNIPGPQASKSNGVLITFSLVSFLLCVAIFYYFYHTQVLYREAKTIEVITTPITQESIDAIIAIEPSAPAGNALSQSSIDSIIRAEGRDIEEVEELSPEQITNLKRAN